MSVGKKKVSELKRQILLLEDELERLMSKRELLVEDVWYQREDLRELKKKVAFEKRMFKAICKDSLALAQSSGLVPEALTGDSDAH